MLSPPDLSRHLSHDTNAVRDHALRSLALAGDRSEVKADVPLAVLGRLGAIAFTNPTLIAQLPLTVDVAQKACESAAEASLPLRTVAAAILRELPPDLLAACRDLIHQLPAGDLRTRLERRIALAQQPHDKLWNQLLSSTDPADTHDLILALIPHDSAIAPLLASTLARNAPAPGELAATELAGRLRLATTINALVDRLSRTEPAIAEAAAVAVGRLGTAGAATVLEQRCNLASATPTFRVYAARAMSHFRIPSVEATLLRLLAEEDDQSALCSLCAALADVCTTTGFPRLAEVVASGRCGVQATALQLSVSALDTMLRSPAAKSAPTHQPAATPSPAPPPATGGPIVTTLNSGGFSAVDVTDPELTPPSDEFSLMEIPDQAPPAHPAHSAPSAPRPAPSATAPLHRSTTQVGRNDPCPCGSGKKYKKCCGA